MKLCELFSRGMNRNTFNIFPALSLFPISRLLHFPPLKLKFNFHEFLANVNSGSRSLYVVVRPSVYRLSVVGRLSVTFVRPTKAIKIFGNVSTPFGTMAIC